MSSLDKRIAKTLRGWWIEFPWGSLGFSEYMSKIAPVCNYNPLSMLSAQTGQCVSESVDALIDLDFIHSPWKLATLPLIPVAAALVCLEIGIDLFTRPKTGFRKIKNLYNLLRYCNTPGPEKNHDILWSMEAEAHRRCPNGADMFELYSLNITLDDDFRDYFIDPPGKNFFSLPWEEVQTYFQENRINEKHERLFRGCPDCEDCAVYTFLDNEILEDPANRYRRYWHTVQDAVREI